MSRFLYGPFISDKIKPTIEEQETVQDKKILNLFDNTENLNDNFHEVILDHYYFGVNLLNRNNYTFGNNIDQQLLKTIVRTNYFMNNGFYLKDNYINFEKKGFTGDSLQIEIPLYGLYNFLHKPINLKDVVQNELPFHLKYHDIKDSDGNPIKIMSNFYHISFEESNYEKMYVHNFLVNKENDNLTRDDIETIFEFMNENIEKHKYQDLFKELIYELNSILKDNQEFSIIIFKKTDVPGFIVKDKDLMEMNINNCVLDKTLSYENTHLCSHYNTIAYNVNDENELSRIENKCNSEPNCRWDENICKEKSCEEITTQTECTQPCKWKGNSQNNGKFKYIIKDEEDKLHFHTITKNELQYFNLESSVKNSLLQADKPDLLGLVNTTIGSIINDIKAEGFGRRLTFLDIFLGLLVIVLLFKLKK